MSQSNFIVRVINGVRMYGTNKTSNYNGVVNWKLIGPKLVLPSSLDGNKITEVGQYAFCGCNYLKELHISDGIKAIHSHAFAYCPNLTTVIVSPTVEFLYYCAFHAYNRSRTEIFTSEGTMTVTFLANSMIKYIDKYAITRKEHIVIIYHGKVAPKYGENPFYREVILSVKVYSTYLHSFCGLRTILLKTNYSKGRITPALLIIEVIICHY